MRLIKTTWFSKAQLSWEKTDWVIHRRRIRSGSPRVEFTFVQRDSTRCKHQLGLTWNLSRAEVLCWPSAQGWVTLQERRGWPRSRSCLKEAMPNQSQSRREQTTAFLIEVRLGSKQLGVSSENHQGTLPRHIYATRSSYQGIIDTEYNNPRLLFWLIDHAELFQKSVTLHTGWVGHWSKLSFTNILGCHFLLSFLPV